MNTIQQAVTIPTDRRLQLELSLPDSVPTGEAEMLIVLRPVRKTTSLKPLRYFAGRLAHSATFAGDPVQLQRTVRDEW